MLRINLFKTFSKIILVFTTLFFFLSTQALVYKRQTNIINLPITNFVHDVVETKNGYLWFATDDGLSAFDGNRYKQYRDIDSRVLDTDAIVTLALGSDDTIWLGTYYELASFDYKSQTFISYKYQENGNNIKLSIQEMVILPNNLIVINTLNKGLFLFDITSKKFIKGFFDRIKLSNTDTRINYVDIDNVGNELYLLSREKGVSRFKIRRNKLLNHNIKEEILKFNNIKLSSLNRFKIYNNQLCVTEKNQLHLINLTTLKTINLVKFPKSRIDNSESYSITSILFSQEYGILLSTRNSGLLIIKNKKILQDISYQLDQSTLSENRLMNLFEDRFGTIWIMGIGNSVDTLAHNSQTLSAIVPITKLSLKDLKPYSVNAIYRNKNKLWLGTDNGVLINNNYQGQTGLIEFEKSNLKNLNIAGIIPIEDNFFVMTARLGLWLLDSKGSIIKKIKLSKTDSKHLMERYGRILQDKDKNIWVVDSNKLYKLDIKSTTNNNDYNFQFIDIKSSFTIIKITETEGERFLISTYLNGVYWFNKATGELSQALKINKQFKMLHDTNYYNGVLFLTTDMGLFSYHIKSKKLTLLIPLDKGISVANIYNSYVMNEDKIILGLSDRLALFNIKSGKYYNFDLDHLLSTPNFNQEATFVYEGLLYLGTVSGIAVLDLDKFNTQISDKIPSVIISEIEYTNYKKHSIPYYLSELSEINLPNNTHTVRLYFSSLNHPNNKQFIYRYKLTGLSDDWMDFLNEKYHIEFNNLPSGNYQFQIQASIDGQNWGKTTTVRILIATPVWKTWQAYFVYLIIGITIIYFLLKNRINLIRAKFE